ncbi:MAG: CbbQ/NirQ/NorQ/GpvN family protein, partial [Methylothermaceae bacterium]|nr:CbbQ/NirQ/NorQ/GpvN family protein [Methylothermaceae bacterium]
MKVVVKDAFQIEAPANYVAEGFDDASNPFIPRRDDNYVFRKGNVRDLLAFLREPMGDGFYITGPTGSGKTSLVCQTA